jgi:hypothetical protein
MRIISWNCYRGECRSRASQLDSLNADLIILQECGRPVSIDTQTLWFGDRSIQGVGIVARREWTIEPGPIEPAANDSVYPVKVFGPTPFNLLAVWSQRRPTYVRAILDGLDRYRAFLTAAPSLIVGDFNSHTRWDGSDPTANHSVLVERLTRDFGLVSAYHSVPGRSDEDGEAATFYWQWKEGQPFHIDYCFLPEQWVGRLQSVQVGGYGEWAKESDHRPVVVELGP